MKKNFLVKTESLKKILDCFSDHDEFREFASDLSGMIDEIIFAGHLAHRNIENDEFVIIMALKQFFVFGLFCQQNVEIIHQLINVVEYTEITEEEKKNLSKESENKDEDERELNG